MIGHVYPQHADLVICARMESVPAPALTDVMASITVLMARMRKTAALPIL